MPFPQGGDFVTGVSGTLPVVQSDRRICVNDNGTSVCGAGYKLKTPGTCFNQPIGSFNSTDPTFQPTFPVCTSDYLSSGFYSAFISAKGNAQVSGFLGQGDEASGDLVQPAISKSVQSFFKHLKVSISDESAYNILEGSNSASSSYGEASVSPNTASFMRYAQFSPGSIKHDSGVYSDLFKYDVYSSFNTAETPAFFFIETLAARFKQAALIDSQKNTVNTDYYTTISGSTDPCVGDGTPPYITYNNPTQSGTLLASTDQVVDFSFGDTVAGVDLSTVSVILTSSDRADISLIDSGTDQTGGNVNVSGDQSEYRFVYTPPFTWNYNERVVVVISGSDLPPTVDGNPFFCEGSDTNTFIGDITFKVLNFDGISASISGVADTTPPYISDASPAQGSNGNDVFTSVELKVADDITGVDLDTVQIDIGGIAVVESGTAVTGETTITGDSSEYTFVYSPNNAFDYGDTVTVSADAYDKSSDGPNLLSDSYTLSFVSDNTLSIENFSPGVGTTPVTSGTKLSVDLIDSTYGIDTDQSFFVINNTITSGTFTTISGGQRMDYNPPNNFDYGKPVNVTVHAVNGNTSAPAVKEEFYTFYHGYRIKYFNEQPYEFEQQVDVFVQAKNTELFYKDVATGYFFSVQTQPSNDLGASITAINPTSNISADITPLAPEHRYGQTVTVEVYVADFDGHELGPFTYTYTIEDKPD